MNFSDLDAFIDSLIPYGIPGADYLIMRDHKPIYRHSAGWRDREAQIPVRGDELYFLYSCSKAVTAAAALQLYEKGYYLLDTPLYEFLPEYRRMTVRTANGELAEARNPILMRHLFTMSAGLDYDLDTPVLIETKAATGGLCPTVEIAKALAKQPLAFEPGTHFLYSLCHDVLAAVVEVISRRKFRDYVKENIFDPLSMTHSGYHMVPGTENQFAAQYRYDDSEHFAKRIPLENCFLLGPEHDSGGAGMISSVEDYAKFTDAMACEGIGATGERILSNTTIDLMRTNFMNDAQMSDFNWPQMGGYGYGLGVRTLIDRTGGGGVLSPIGEFGWAGAAGEYFLMDPANRLSVFYGQHMLNSKEPYVHPRLRNVTYACLGK